MPCYAYSVFVSSSLPFPLSFPLLSPSPIWSHPILSHPILFHNPINWLYERYTVPGTAYCMREALWVKDAIKLNRKGPTKG